MNYLTSMRKAFTLLQRSYEQVQAGGHSKKAATEALALVQHAEEYVNISKQLLNEKIEEES